MGFVSSPIVPVNSRHFSRKENQNKSRKMTAVNKEQVSFPQLVVDKFSTISIVFPPSASSLFTSVRPTRWDTFPRISKRNLAISGLEESHKMQKLQGKSLISLFVSVSVLPRYLQYLPDLLSCYSYRSSLDPVGFSLPCPSCSHRGRSLESNISPSIIFMHSLRRLQGFGCCPSCECSCVY